MINDFQTLHHANILMGGPEALTLLKENLDKIGFSTRGNPDYYESTTNPFGVDEARSLALWSYGKPISGERKVAIVVARSITHEAQNALLKTLEEPPSGTYFFLVLQNTGDLLGTLLSRVRVYSAFSKESLIKEAAANFAKLSVAGKMALIKNLSKSEDKEPMKDLINSLEPVLKTKKILLAKKFASRRGSSPKMILEWLVASV